MKFWSILDSYNCMQFIKKSAELLLLHPGNMSQHKYFRIGSHQSNCFASIILNTTKAK